MICIRTWSDLQFDVPRHRGDRLRFFRRLMWMLIALLAPEYILFKSAIDFFEARDLAKYLKDHGKQQWNLTWRQFALAHGFRIRAWGGDSSGGSHQS